MLTVYTVHMSIISTFLHVYCLFSFNLSTCLLSIVTTCPHVYCLLSPPVNMSIVSTCLHVYCLYLSTCLLSLPVYMSIVYLTHLCMPNCTYLHAGIRYTRRQLYQHLIWENKEIWPRDRPPSPTIPPTPLFRPYFNAKPSHLNVLGMGGGERHYVLVTRNIFLLRSANRNAKQNLERGSAGTLTLERGKNCIQEHRSVGTQRQNRGMRNAKHFRNARPSLHNIADRKQIC